MSDRFEDERGVIQDLLGQVDAVTRITTVEGAVGNHFHSTRRSGRCAHRVSVMATGDTTSDGVRARSSSTSRESRTRGRP